MKARALIALTVGWCWDRFTLVDPMRGINDPAEQRRREVLRAWGLT
jgi:hypothetical protein